MRGINLISASDHGISGRNSGAFPICGRKIFNCFPCRDAIRRSTNELRIIWLGVFSFWMESLFPKSKIPAPTNHASWPRAGGKFGKCSPAEKPGTVSCVEKNNDTTRLTVERPCGVGDFLVCESVSGNSTNMRPKKDHFPDVRSWGSGKGLSPRGKATIFPEGLFTEKITFADFPAENWRVFLGLG